jgi:hypothetical protein
MTDRHFRTADACLIAETNHNRFNDAVAAGNYPCAPQTEPGSARVFWEPDLIALYIYARLVARDKQAEREGSGYPPRIAGSLACKVREVLQQQPNAQHVVVVREVAGQTSAFVAQAGELVSVKGRGQNVLVRMAFDIDNIRRLVRHSIDVEFPVEKAGP